MMKVPGRTRAGITRRATLPHRRCYHRARNLLGWLGPTLGSAWGLQQELVYDVTCDGQPAGELRVVLRSDEDGHRFVDLEATLGADVRWGRLDATLTEEALLGRSSQAALNVDGAWTQVRTRLDTKVDLWGVYVEGPGGSSEVGYKRDAISLSSLDLFDPDRHRALGSFDTANLILLESGEVIRGRVTVRGDGTAQVGAVDLASEGLRFKSKRLSLEADWLDPNGHLARLRVDWMGHRFEATLRAVPQTPNFGTTDGTVTSTGMQEESL